MVDPLGTTPVKTSLKVGDPVAPVTRVAAPVAAAPVTARETDSVSPSTLASAAKELATQPPIDLERVAKIRKAIADGTFPIVPAQIADRLIAAKLEWLRNDAE